MITIIMRYGAILFAALAAISMLMYAGNVLDCLSENGLDDECFRIMIFEHPQVRPAMAIAEACGESDEKCLKEMGTQMALKKVETSVKNYPKNTEKD
jgi:hypothetical protein